MTVDPVVAADGYTYERDAITNWFATAPTSSGTAISPMTQEPLRSFEVTPNVTVRTMARDWAKTHE
jgi:hypothetical protein